MVTEDLEKKLSALCFGTFARLLILHAMKFETKVLHAGIEPDPTTGAIMTPIYQTSTYVQDAVGKHKGYEYARTQNPTRDVLQKNLAALENGKHGLVFGSGMAAIDTLMKLLKPGDEVISCSDHLIWSSPVYVSMATKDWSILA